MTSVLASVASLWQLVHCRTPGWCASSSIEPAAEPSAPMKSRLPALLWHLAQFAGTTGGSSAFQWIQASARRSAWPLDIHSPKKGISRWSYPNGTVALWALAVGAMAPTPESYATRAPNTAITSTTGRNGLNRIRCHLLHRVCHYLRPAEVVVARQMRESNMSVRRASCDV